MEVRAGGLFTAVLLGPGTPTRSVRRKQEPASRRHGGAPQVGQARGREGPVRKLCPGGRSGQGRGDAGALDLEKLLDSPALGGVPRADWDFHPCLQRPSERARLRLDCV